MQKNRITEAWDTATNDERTEFIFDLDNRYKGGKMGTGIARIYYKFMDLIEREKALINKGDTK